MPGVARPPSATAISSCLSVAIASARRTSTSLSAGCPGADAGIVLGGLGVVDRAVLVRDDVEDDVGETAAGRDIGDADLHVLLPAQLRNRRGLEFAEQVDLSVRESRHPRVGVVDRLEDHLVDHRAATVVVVERRQLDRLVLDELGQPEGAGADHLGVLEGEGVLGLPDVLRQDVHEQHPVLEVADRLAGHDGERCVVLGGDRLEDVRVRRLVREVRVVAVQLERELDVVGRRAGSPSWNVASSRRVTVQVTPSSATRPVRGQLGDVLAIGGDRDRRVVHELEELEGLGQQREPWVEAVGRAGDTDADGSAGCRSPASSAIGSHALVSAPGLALPPASGCSWTPVQAASSRLTIANVATDERSIRTVPVPPTLSAALNARGGTAATTGRGSHMPRNPVNISHSYAESASLDARGLRHTPTMTSVDPRSLVRAQVALESFRLCPDGASVVYVLRRVLRDEYESHLWTRPYRGGRARQLTRGRVRDGSPAISPDGRRVAFVRSPVGDDAAVAQAWILPLDGGEPWQLTSAEARCRQRALEP